MIWCRFEVQGKSSYGMVEDGRVTQVWGNPLREYAVTVHSYPLDQVKLLAPIRPAMLYAAGPNYRGHVEGMAARRGTPPSYPDRPSPNYRSVHGVIGTDELSDDVFVHVTPVGSENSIGRDIAGLSTTQ